MMSATVLVNIMVEKTASNFHPFKEILDILTDLQCMYSATARMVLENFGGTFARCYTICQLSLVSKRIS